VHKFSLPIFLHLLPFPSITLSFRSFFVSLLCSATHSFVLCSFISFSLFYCCPFSFPLLFWSLIILVSLVYFYLQHLSLFHPPCCHHITIATHPYHPPLIIHPYPPLFFYSFFHFLDKNFPVDSASQSTEWRHQRLNSLNQRLLSPLSSSPLVLPRSLPPLSCPCLHPCLLPLPPFLLSLLPPMIQRFPLQRLHFPHLRVRPPYPYPYPYPYPSLILPYPPCVYLNPYPSCFYLFIFYFYRCRAGSSQGTREADLRELQDAEHPFVASWAEERLPLQRLRVVLEDPLGAPPALT